MEHNEYEKHLINTFKYNPYTGEITNLKSNKTITRLGNYGYIQVRFGYKGKTKYLDGHRLAWFLYYGKWPIMHIDHINGIRNDNSLHNLRDVSNRDNQLNRKLFNNGHLPGTTKLKSGNWQARIRHGKKRVSLGLFETQLEAHNAYLKYRKEHDL